MATIKSGRNPTMQYLHRTRRVSVQWLHERSSDTQGAPVEIKYADSADMKADIFIKASNEE
eukprot:12478593-Alexandrium_andersonii.AAC.1